jgi:hypothetical protein
VAQTPAGLQHLCYYNMFQEGIKVVSISYQIDTYMLESPYIVPNRIPLHKPHRNI